MFVDTRSTNYIYTQHCYCFLVSNNCRTTLGSANVEVSPNSSSCPAAIFLSTRRMIFPLLVFGRPGACAGMLKKVVILSEGGD